MCEILCVQSCTKVSKSVECVPCNQKIPAIGDKSGIGLSNCTEGQLAGVLSTPLALHKKSCNECATPPAPAAKWEKKDQLQKLKITISFDKVQLHGLPAD